MEEEQPKLSLAQWQALSAQARQATEPEDRLRQVQAYYTLMQELEAKPADDQVRAVIEAYDGPSDDYVAKVRWIKRAHLLQALKKVDTQLLKRAPALHQMAVHEALSKGIDEVELLWQVWQDLADLDQQEREADQKQQSLNDLAQSTPVLEEPQHIDRWQALEKKKESKEDD